MAAAVWKFGDAFDVVALMYEGFFGLRERPFDLTPDPRFLFMTPGIARR